MDNSSFNESYLTGFGETQLFGVALDHLTMGTKLQFINCIIIIFGIIGNLTVVIITLANSNMRSTTNYLVSNLAIADSLVLLTHLPLPISENTAWCKGVHFLLYIACNASVGSMLALAIDRYLAIVHYSSSSPFRSVKRVNIGMAIMWLLIVTYSLPELWMFGVRQTGNKRRCVFLRDEGWNSVILSIFLVLVGYLIPLVSITTLYLLLCKYIKDTESNVTVGMNVSRKPRNKAIPMLIASVAAYAVCYAPIAVGYVIYICGLNPFKYVEYVITYSMLVTVNSSINPLLYALFSESYRTAFKKLFADMFF